MHMQQNDKTYQILTTHVVNIICVFKVTPLQVGQILLRNISHDYKKQTCRQESRRFPSRYHYRKPLLLSQPYYKCFPWPPPSVCRVWTPVGCHWCPWHWCRVLGMLLLGQVNHGPSYVLLSAMSCLLFKLCCHAHINGKNGLIWFKIAKKNINLRICVK